MTEPQCLEEMFGDPSRGQGVLNYDAVQASDAARTLDAQGEDLLTEWGFGAEFVPRRYGGRWGSTEDLVRRLLPIFRRDPALGLGQGVTSLMAAANVWVAGDGPTQQSLAARLLAGERAAVAFHELNHGNDLLRNDCRAEYLEGQQAWKLNGRKEVINNIARAESVLLFARTANEPGPKSFSLLMWQKDRTLGGIGHTKERIHTAGVRGCQLGVVEFDDLTIPSDSLVGAAGDGTNIALRAFQITRAVIPALATGTVDAALRLCVVYLRQRNLYGQTAWNFPHARATIARAWGALLTADAMARASVRALHLHPDECFIASAATKYLVPMLLNDAMNEISVLFGSTFYARSEDFGILEKWVRDLIVLPIGHAGSMTCLSGIIPHLPLWARRSGKHSSYDPALFRADTVLEDIEFSRFRLGSGSSDSLTAPLESEAVISAVLSEWPELADLIARWCHELRFVREAATLLNVVELAADASPHALDISRRLCRLMAVGSLLGTWYEERTSSTSPFNRSSFALFSALCRVSDLLPTGPNGRTGIGRDVWHEHEANAAAADVAAAVDNSHSVGIEETYFPWSSGGQK